MHANGNVKVQIPLQIRAKLVYSYNTKTAEPRALIAFIIKGASELTESVIQHL